MLSMMASAGSMRVEHWTTSHHAMLTVEDVLVGLQRPRYHTAPSWRVRITFKDGTGWDQTYEPIAPWPAQLIAHPPVRFIARQTMDLVRFYWRELGMEAERVAIQPPPGTTDDRGREVQGEILLAIVRL